MSRGGSDRVVEKLRTALANGEYYQAHQLYRTLYFRYCASQKYDELASLLYEGATRFLTDGEYTSGNDLANLYVEVLKQSHGSLNIVESQRLKQLFALLYSELDEVTNRYQFVRNVFAWSKEVDPQYKMGHPQIHEQFAHVLWDEKNYAEARYHFMLSKDGEGCAAFLIEYHQRRGYNAEVDLFIAQAVLQFLCHKNKPTAQITFSTYTTKHPNIDSGPPFVLPLLNFVWLLLLCIDSGQLSQFTILVEKYQPSIKRDPNYIQYLDRIGQLFFGVPPPRNQSSSGMGGFLGNLLHNIMGSGTDEGDASGADDDFGASYSVPNVSASSVVPAVSGSAPYLKPQAAQQKLLDDELD